MKGGKRTCLALITNQKDDFKDGNSKNPLENRMNRKQILNIIIKIIKIEACFNLQ